MSLDLGATTGIFSSPWGLVLYHVSGWVYLATVQVGDRFTLRPSTQCAEGPGVYFSEGVARVSAAEGCAMQPSAVVVMAAPEGTEARTWWRTKASIARKHGRPVTWHSAGADVVCDIRAIEIIDGLRHLHVERFAADVYRGSRDHLIREKCRA